MKPARSSSTDDVERRDRAVHDPVGGRDVGGPVAVGQVTAGIAVGGGIDLLVRDRGKAEAREHRLHRPRSLRAHREHVVLGDRLDPRVDLPVALGRHPLVEVVGVVVAAAEGVVLAGHHRVARRDEVGARQELAHQLCGLANLRMRRDRVVPRRDLEIEPRGEDVLGQDLAHSTGHRQHQRHARDRPVLHALGAGGADRGQAAGLEIQHRAALGVAHQRLGAATGGEPHLHAAGGVGRGEEGFRPRRVVAVHEDRLRPVHRQRLRVRDEPLDRELEVAALLDRTLRHHPRTSGLRADQDRDRIQRRVARDAHRRLHLGEAPRRRLGGVRGQQSRVLLQVRDVRLIGRGPPGAELLQREHQLDRVEQRDDAGEPRRRQAAGQTDEIGARDVDVDEPVCDLLVGELRCLRGDVEVEAVARDEPVDDVEVLCAAAVHRHHPAVLDLEPRLGVVGAVHRDQPQLRVGRDQDLAAELATLARGEPLRPPRAHPSPAGRARRTRSPPRARTRP